MSVSEARLDEIAAKLEGTDLYLGQHGGRYKIGTLPDDYDHPEGHRAEYFAISATGDGFRGTVSEVEAFARGIAAAPAHRLEVEA